MTELEKLLNKSGFLLYKKELNWKKLWFSFQLEGKSIQLAYNDSSTLRGGPTNQQRNDLDDSTLAKRPPPKALTSLKSKTFSSKRMSTFMLSEEVLDKVPTDSGRILLLPETVLLNESSQPTYKKNCFQIDDHLFSALTESEKASWLKALRTVIDTLKVNSDPIIQMLEEKGTVQVSRISTTTPKKSAVDNKTSVVESIPHFYSPPGAMASSPKKISDSFRQPPGSPKSESPRKKQFEPARFLRTWSVDQKELVVRVLHGSLIRWRVKKLVLSRKIILQLLNEFLLTESSYVKKLKRLKELQDVFRRNAASQQSGERSGKRRPSFGSDKFFTYSETLVQDLFSNIDSLLAIHNEAFPNMEKICSQVTKKGISVRQLAELRDQFVNTFWRFIGSKLWLYQRYAKNFGKATSTLDAYSDHKYFCAFLVQHAGISDTSDLKEIIATPLERMHQYTDYTRRLEKIYLMYIEYLHGYGVEESDDNNRGSLYDRIYSEVRAIKDTLINEENLAKLFAIGELHGGKLQLGFNHKFIREGELEFKDKEGNMRAKVYLFDDTILISTSNKKGTRQKCRRVYPLKDVRLDDLQSLPQGTLNTGGESIDRTASFKLLNLVDEELCYLIGKKVEDKNEWVKAISKALYAFRAFKVPVEELSKREKQSVPYLVQDCVSYLLESGVDQLNIFRVSPNYQRLKDVVQRLEQGLRLDTSNVDPILVAEVLKTFLRELPEPLLTERLFDEWMRVGSIEDRTIQLESARKLIESLPSSNRNVTKIILPLLSKIGDRSEVNRMSSAALAVIFSPLFLFSKDPAFTGNLFTSKTLLNVSNQITELLITNYEMFE